MIDPLFAPKTGSWLGSDLTSSRPSVAVIFQRLGPYHHARLAAVSARCNVVAIELTASDSVYDWQPVKGIPSFTKYTLFESDIDMRSFATLRLRISEVIEEVHPNVVFVPGWGTTGTLAAHFSCAAAGVPIVLMSESTAHDARRRWWKEAMKRRVVSLCSAGLVGGQPHAEYLASLGMPRERIFTGYDVVDNAHFVVGAQAARQYAHLLRGQLGLPEHYFLASNRFVEKKNLPRLLQAYARYRNRAGHSAWALVLLGDGPLKPQILRVIDELGLREDTVLVGFKQYDELPVYYGLAGAFVHASTTEQWGLVVNEAMAAGLPVVVSQRCGCAPALVENARNGFVFDPCDVDELASLMLKVASTDCDRETMGQASRQIISYWSPELFAASLLRSADVALNTPRRQSWVDRALLNLLGMNIGK
jgi:1,2-diacylglycerol 3-alpha-glucosyltransferase